MDILSGIAVGFGLLGVVMVGLAVRAVRGGRWGGGVARTGGGALFLALGALAGTLGVSTHGYRALTQEELALTVTTVPTGARTFQAFLEFPDGRDTTLHVLGDQLLVDAHILKWQYFANVLGYSTQYELDRLTGRYVDIEHERALPRTVHSLKTEKPVDLFDLVARHAWLRFLVDTEYGSATYVDVDAPARFQVLVSTTGLLVRPVPF
ncbi:MAG: hypothetical protein WEA34_04370 [Gemmatimonadota bacterium]